MPYVLQDRRVGLREPIDKSIVPFADDGLWIEVAIIALVSDGILKFRELITELRAREKRGDDITGDLNFCICRLLVGFTSIHTEPRYSKVHFINKTLRLAAEYVRDAKRDELDVDRAGAVLEDVKMELYRRYAGPYEDLKRRPVSEGGNGDIMD